MLDCVAKQYRNELIMKQLQFKAESIDPIYFWLVYITDNTHKTWLGPIFWTVLLRFIWVMQISKQSERLKKEVTITFDF